MTGPDATGGADDDAPTVPGLGPVPSGPAGIGGLGPVPSDPGGIPGLGPLPPDPGGIPGLHYMPRPDDPPPDGGAHRRDPPRRPWPWLAGLAALAVVAALGTAWTIGGLTDPTSRRQSSAAAPTTDPLMPTQPTDTGDAFPTAPDFSTAPTPSASLSPTVTIPPAPSASSVSPRPTPRPGPVRVPDVVGERRGAAEATLRAAGFAVSVQLVRAPSPRQVRRVIAQLPTAGQLAPAGSVVVLLVGDR